MLEILGLFLPLLCSSALLMKLNLSHLPTFDGFIFQACTAVASRLSLSILLFPMIYAGDGLYWVGCTIFSSFSSFHTSSLCWPLLALQYLRWTGSPTLKLCVNSGVANVTPGKVSPKCIGSQEANTTL